MSDIYESLSQERKELQAKGLLPQWYTTSGYQLLKKKYLSPNETPLERYKTVAATAASYTEDPVKWEAKFFDVMWKGWLSPATPVLSNMGTPKGCSVSCSGQYVGDEIYEFYENLKESAVLSQNGFGTSAYLGDIRHRGSPYKAGGKASGVLPIVKDFVQMSRNISQGSSRRGSVALYLEADHKDALEVMDYASHYPDDLNLGWLLTPEFVKALNDGCEDALKRYQKILKIRSVLGKGYLMKTWTAQEQRPQMYKDLGLDVKASNLCTEIMLYSDKDHSFTCVLSSMNIEHYDEWRDTDAVFTATVFLDCVCQHFIVQGKQIKGLEKAVRFTEKSRALGLGVLGYHTYLQKKRVPFSSPEATLINLEVFKKLHDDSLAASKHMAKALGEPEWCKGYGVRNTHRCVTGDTKIFTSKGQLEIKDIVGKDVEVWNGSEYSKVTPFETGVSDIYRVKLSNGLYVDCTSDHKFLIATPKRDTSTFGGLKTIEVETLGLRVGDCLPKFETAASCSGIDLKHAYTAGLFCGDGSISNAREGKYPRNELRLYGEKMKLKDFVEWKSETTWGGDDCVRGYLPDDLLPKFSVPHAYSKVSKQAWLAGLVDSDGSSGSKGVTITMKDYDFAKEVSLLVQSLGGEPVVMENTRTGGYSTEDNIYYSVSISLHSLNIVFDEFKPKRVKVNVLKNKTKVGKRHLVEIVSVEKLVGQQMTYCFTEPKRGLGVFNGILTRQCAVAPTMSTSLLVGGVSQGIEPVSMNVYTQVTAGGSVRRINPVLLQIMIERGVYNKEVLKDIEENAGSVQHVKWLNDHEKQVFLTAFEIDQRVILKQASQRQKYICQAQSLNLFFAGDSSEAEISEVTQQFIEDPRLITLYYQRSKTNVKASKGECVACHA